MGVFGWARKSGFELRKRFRPQPIDSYAFRCAMLSSPGRVRKGNEDACLADREQGVFAVCDGMGGAAAGEVASHVAAEAFLKALTPERARSPRRATPDVRVDAAVRAANDAVYERSRRSIQLKGMGTTLVALLLEIDPAKPDPPSLTLVHVGDSRCYRYREGILELLTDDHSLVEEQVRLGEMTPEEAAVHPMRNIITRAIGSQEEVEPEVAQLDPMPGDLYMLASDGLTRDLSGIDLDEIITRAVLKSRNGMPNLESLCQTLVSEANDAGGGDNITVLLLQLPKNSESAD